MATFLRVLLSMAALFQGAISFTPLARPQQRSALSMGESYGWTGKPDKMITNIWEANKKWKYGKLAEDHEFFDKLGSGHAPKYLWIGCADARVPANEIMGEDAGSVFVCRNVANLVLGIDFNVMAALQYAVSVLRVPHIIVCGHYDCGGIRASTESKDHGPPLENWLRNIRDVYRLHRNELDAIADPEQRHRRLVELNVIEQCINLFKTGVVQRRRVETFKERQMGIDHSDPKALDYTTPRIHACVFDPRTGDLHRLEVDFREFIEELHTIYDLYSLDEQDVMAEKPHAPMPANDDNRFPNNQQLYQPPRSSNNNNYQTQGSSNQGYGPSSQQGYNNQGYGTSNQQYGNQNGAYGSPSQSYDSNQSYSPKNGYSYGNSIGYGNNTNGAYGTGQGDPNEDYGTYTSNNGVGYQNTNYGNTDDQTFYEDPEDELYRNQYPSQPGGNMPTYR